MERKHKFVATENKEINIYEETQFAKIKSKINTTPAIKSALKGNYLFCAINKTFGIYDINNLELNFKDEFEYIIDSFCCIKSLVLLFLRNGHVLIIKKQYDSFVFANEMDAQLNNVVDCFLEDEEGLTAIVVTLIGEIFRITLLNNLENPFIEKKGLIAKCYAETKSASFLYPRLLVITNDNLILYNLKSKDLLKSDSVCLKRALLMNSMIYALQSDGSVIHFCPFTLLMLKKEEAIHNLWCTVDEENKLINLIKTDLNDNRKIHIKNYDLDIEFTNSIDNDVYVIPTERDIFLIYHGNSDDYIFSRVYITSVEEKLLRLVNDKSFDEAEKLAIEYNISRNLIFEGRVKNIIDKNICTEIDVINLLTIFDSIESIDLVLDSCLEVHKKCERFDDLVRILLYTNNRITGDKKGNLSVKEQAVQRLFHWFKLFQDLNYDIRDWPDFSDCDLLEKLIQFLKKLDFRKASILYQFIVTNCETSINEFNVKEILNTLNVTEKDRCLKFLECFILLTVKQLPSSLDLILEWIDVDNLLTEWEATDPDNFFKRAVHFLQEILNCFNGTKFSKYHCLNQYYDRIERYKKYILILRDLQKLDYKYNISIPFAKYLQDQETLINICLDSKLSQNNYDQLLDEFVLKLIKQNGLDSDEVLFEKINDILLRDESKWFDVVNSLLNRLRSSKKKVEAAELILLASELPWSLKVKNFGLQIVREYRPLADNVETILNMEEALLVFAKYNIKMLNAFLHNPIEVEDKVTIMARSDLPTLIEDAFSLCVCKSFFYPVIWILGKHYIEKCDYGSVLMILNRCSKEQMDYFINDILWDSEYLVNTCIESPIIDNRLPILKNLLENYRSQFDDIQYDKFCTFYDALNKVFEAHRKLDVKIETYDVTNLRWSTVFEVLRIKVDQREDEEITNAELIEFCKKFSAYVPFKTEKLIFECCKIIDENLNGLLSFLFDVADELLRNHTRCKYLMIAAVYIFKNLQFGQMNFVETSFINYGGQSTDSADNDVFLKGHQLMTDLLEKAWKFSSQHEKNHFGDFSSWLKVLTSMKKDPIPEDSPLTGDQLEIFSLNWEKSVQHVSVCPSSLAIVQKTFNSFLSIIDHEEDELGLFKYLSYFNKDVQTPSQEEFQEELDDFSLAISSLIQKNQYALTYQLTATFIAQLKAVPTIEYSTVEKLIDILKTKCLPKTIPPLISKKFLDRGLLASMLTWCSGKELFKHVVYGLQSHRSDIPNTKIIAQLGSELFDHNGMVQEKSFCDGILTAVNWWNKLNCHKVKPFDFLKLKPNARLDLLIGSDDIKIQHLKNYCLNYQLKLDEYLLKFLRHTLLEWSPQYKIIETASGSKSLDLPPNQERTLHLKCSEIIDSLTDKETTIDLLHGVWKNVNYYYYEVFLCILDLLQKYSNPTEDLSQHRSIADQLTFLRSYRRTGGLSEAEKERWFTLFPERPTVDELSDFRLLFDRTLLQDNVKEVMRLEITLQNYEIWFDAVGLFPNLTVDDVCTVLVKELVARGELKSIQPNNWLQSSHSDFFYNVKRCLDHMESVEKRNASANHLLVNTPMGADGVIIAEIAFSYANEYKNMSQINMSFMSKSYSKIEKRYQRSRTTQILHVNGLADPSYIELAVNPHQLIIDLYNDQRILMKFDPFVQCPDINKAVREIANVYDMNVEDCQGKLIMELLGDSNQNHSRMLALNDSNNCNVWLADGNRNRFGNEENLKRAAYICESNLPFWQNELNKIGSSISKNDNFHYKANCLECLLSISDPLKIEEICGYGREGVRLTIEDYRICDILQHLGVEYTEPRNINVKNIVKRLAQIGDPICVRGLADICRIFKLRDHRYWQFVLEKSAKHCMFDELYEYLLHLNQKEFIYQQYYKDGWKNYVLYIHNSVINSEENVKKLQIYSKIKYCPILHLLDLEESLVRYLKGN